MIVRLYLDEDSMDHALVLALRGRGVDILTTMEAGMLARLDEDNLEFATSRQLPPPKSSRRSKVSRPTSFARSILSCCACRRSGREATSLPLPETSRKRPSGATLKRRRASSP